MKLRRDAKTLRQKALSSLRRGLVAFNDYNDDGRVTTVLVRMWVSRWAVAFRRVCFGSAAGSTFAVLIGTTGGIEKIRGCR